MRLPADSAAWSQCVRYGIYVYRRTLTAGFTDEAGAVKSSSLQLRDQGRAWEDSEIDVQEALADRDARVSALGALARETRRTLLSRSDRADQTAPYTLIFPEGLAEYVECHVDEVQSNYKQLRDRINTNLPPEDVLRVDLIPRLEAALTSHSTAETTLEDARNVVQRARDSLESLRKSWDLLLEQTFGTVMAKLGKADAEDFFPQVRVSRSGSSE